MQSVLMLLIMIYIVFQQIKAILFERQRYRTESKKHGVGKTNFSYDETADNLVGSC